MNLYFFNCNKKYMSIIYFLKYLVNFVFIIEVFID